MLGSPLLPCILSDLHQYLPVALVDPAQLSVFVKSNNEELMMLDSQSHTMSVETTKEVRTMILMSLLSLTKRMLSCSDLCHGGSDNDGTSQKIQ